MAMPLPEREFRFSDQELMSFTGVSITTKRNMEMKGVFVRLNDRLWDAKKSIQNYIEHLKKRHRTGLEDSNTDGEDIRDADTEYRKQKARKERMLADQMAGKLIEVDAVARMWETHVFSAKAKLTAIPDKMMAELLPLLPQGTRPEEIIDPMKRMVDEVMEELAKDPDDGEDDFEEEDEADED